MKLWKPKTRFNENQCVIPYFLYADDFGINNPLGAKSNKNSICNFYYTFPCVAEKSSKLDQIFLACSVKSADIKQYGNEPLIEILKKIEVDEINIETKKGIVKVHFIMGLFLGDNLGMNIHISWVCKIFLIKSLLQILSY